MFALILDSEKLEPHLSQKDVLVVDVSSPPSYVQQHIPGAVFLNYEWILRSEPPRMGLLPTPSQIEQVFSALGITADTQVIAYDDEGGGRASRFLWTLDCAGHKHFSLLNGGLPAWSDAGYAVSRDISWPTPATFKYQPNTAIIADRQYILDHLDDKTVAILDARSPQEYAGLKAFAQRAGHIPGAINVEWTETMDQSRHLRLKADQQLRDMFAAKGIVPDKEVITHCQIHHRSAHTYIVLKHLGFEKIKGYPGSWSDWGNDPSTPIDV